MAHSIYVLIIVAVLLYFALRRIQHRYAGSGFSERLSFGRLGQSKED